MSTLWWGFGKDYPKVQVGGKQYAKIGERLYTETRGDAVSSQRSPDDRGLPRRK